MNSLVRLVRAPRSHFCTHRPVPTSRPATRRLFLEPLEARTCPSQVTVDATTTGYWDQFGKHIQRTQAYETGIDGRYQYNSFYVFDLSNVGGTITDATLVLQNTPAGFNSAQSPLTLAFVNVDTPLDQLTARTDRTNARVDIWQDLGGMKADNEDYGMYDATSADNGALVNIPLTDAAVADLNAAEGQSFAIGASITNLDATDNPQEMFGDTRSTRLTRQLELTIADNGPQAPNPSGGHGNSTLAADAFNTLHGDLGAPLAADRLFSSIPPASPAGTAANLFSQPLDTISPVAAASRVAATTVGLGSANLPAPTAGHDVQADGLTDGLSGDHASLNEASAGVH
jgi:hypothetical protein